MGPITTALLLVVAITLCAFSGEPIDPLVRERERPGAYGWHLELGYLPAGETGHAWDIHGAAYEYARLAHGLRIRLSGDININPSWRTGIGFSDTTWLVHKRRTYPHHTLTEESSVREFSYTLFAETRLASRSPLDPTLTLSVGHPRLCAVEASVNLLRDPVVLLGRLGYGVHADAPNEIFSFSLACAFVANAWVTLGVHASWDIPLSEPAFPTAAIGMLVQYDVDLVGDLRIKAHVTLHLVEDAPLLGVALELAGRGG